jgi:crotonobetainyl-CoA:carnitine CoA-transferase CaiB-like acyl-CoA transferase
MEKISAAEARRPAVDTSLPLAGIRVLDLAQACQGPYATFLMAMGGADVIRIEPPRGGEDGLCSARTDYVFRALNGCKRGMTLDLKSKAGREILLELVRSADVLVETFAPGFMPSLGLGPQDIRKANPRLIYASTSGFGRTGPYAGTPSLDLTIRAMSGFLDATGEGQAHDRGAVAPVADVMSGVHLYGAVVTALYERSLTGKARVVEVSALESLFATVLPAVGQTYSARETGGRTVPEAIAPSGTFDAADGRVAIACATDEQWLGLTQAMARPDLHDDAQLRGVHGRAARRAAIEAEVAKWAKAHARDKLIALCRQVHVPAAPLRDVSEMLCDLHLHARGFLSMQPGDGGPVALPNSPMRYEGSALRPLDPPPTLGQHTDEVLTELCGFEPIDIEQLRRRGVV